MSENDGDTAEAGGNAETVSTEEDAPPPKLPAKPALKSSNSSYQLSRSSSQYRVHFPEPELTKIVETEVIVVPNCAQRAIAHIFCCCRCSSYKS